MNPLLQPTVSQNIIDLVINASIVAKIVLAILTLFSLASWAIIIDKLRVFRRIQRDSDRFLLQFKKHKSPKDILQSSRQFARNPFSAVFKEAYWLFRKENGAGQGSELGGGIDLVREQRSKGNHTHEELVHLFDSVATREVLELEKNLVFLATTGSVSPFFGLFGTVWGVMSAFLSIGFTGSADLSVVAPGIAEALITTVAGLGAAIPAVIAYNYFVSKLKRLSSEIEIFYANLIETFMRKEPHEVR
ncbi:MotA/TolQ/ExbB proton channel family protein [bacterium]|nr:MotA/TolQ/ExbB proton channel family protein [bacterium]